MKAEIITSGTELLLGEVTDTNTPFLARELAGIAINVYHHTTVGDNPKRLLKAIEAAEARADIVLVSGGLGPTQDDITKDILADHLGVDLIEDEPSLEKVRSRHDNDEISEENYRQALILEGSTPLPNDVGMAAGNFIENDGNIYALIPGPPREFEYMVTHHLIPKLAKRGQDDYRLHSRNLNFFGLAESTVAERVADIIEEQTNPTMAIYAKNGFIEIRITASSQTQSEGEELLDKAEAKILERLDHYLFSYGDERMQDVFLEKLAENNQSLALFEVLTDGATTDYWSRELNYHRAFKGGHVFPILEHAQNYYGFTDDISPKKQNEDFAEAIKENNQADYGVAVTGWGESSFQEEAPERIAWMSIATPNGDVITEEVDYTRNQNIARWMLSLRVSDFVRRVLLDLPRLGDEE